MYDPNALDDPEMLHADNKYVQHPAAVTGIKPHRHYLHGHDMIVL